MNNFLVGCLAALGLLFMAHVYLNDLAIVDLEARVSTLEKVALRK